MELANLDAPAGFSRSGCPVGLCPNLASGWSIVLAASLIAVMAPARAQSNSGYDPRSWTYDPARHVLVPSAIDQALEEEDQVRAVGSPQTGCSFQRS